MTKYALILPSCFLLASGCVLFSDPKPATETPTASVAVIEKQEPLPSTTGVHISDPARVEPPAVVAKILTSDDIRRLQRSLLDIGLDPGPIDGIAGGRTKAAFMRLHAACTKVGPLIENLRAPEASGVSGDTIAMLPGRDETRHLQSQLRAAGFDPGPVDGIFGRRTRSTVNQLQSGCITAKESGAMLMDLSSAVANEARPTLSPPPSRPAFPSSPSTVVRANDTPKKVEAITEPRSREDVRILQLRLRDAGFDPGPFDGLMGPRTRAALAQYEASRRDGKIKTSLTNTISGEHY